jgi:hypothetical protein
VQTRCSRTSAESSLSASSTSERLAELDPLEIAHDEAARPATEFIGHEQVNPRAETDAVSKSPGSFIDDESLDEHNLSSGR